MMDASAAETAQAKLELRDIVMHTSKFLRETNLDPLLYPVSVTQKSEVTVSADEISFVDVDDNTIRILRIFVQLCVSGFKLKDKNKSLFSIHATYRVDYLKKEELTEIELDTFNQFNAVHNVWPFWRQHVHEVVSKASLPNIAIPLFRAIPGEPQARRSKRRPIERKS